MEIYRTSIEVIIMREIRMILPKQLTHRLPEYFSKGQESAFYADNLNSGKGQKTIKLTPLNCFL